MSPVILWRRLGLMLIARASCGPEAGLLGHASSLLCAAWGKHRVLLEQLRIGVVLCKITPGSRQGRSLNEPRVYAHRDRARPCFLLLCLSLRVVFPLSRAAVQACCHGDE